VGARHGRRGPRPQGRITIRASRAAVCAGGTRSRGGKRPTNHPPRRPRARTGTWTPRPAGRGTGRTGLTGRHLSFRSLARRGTAPHLLSPAPRVVVTRDRSISLQPHRRRARSKQGGRAFVRDVQWAQHRQLRKPIKAARRTAPLSRP